MYNMAGPLETGVQFLQVSDILQFNFHGWMQVVDLAITCIYKSTYFVSLIFTVWRLTVKLGLDKLGPLESFLLQYG